MSIYTFTTDALSRAIAIFSPRKAIEYQRAHQILHAMREYDAAKLTGHNQKWRPSMKSGDAEARAGAQEIRNRVKSLERNNSYVAGAVKRLVANVVGEGNFPQSKVRVPDGLGIDKVTADKIEQAFMAWAEDCCLNGDGLVDAQILNTRHKVIDGQSFCVVSQSNRDMKIQIIESDQLATSVDGPIGNGNTFAVRGIEIDIYGKPVNYHFYDVHPGDNVRFTTKVQVIPADRVLHVFDRNRASSSMGISQFASVVMNLFDIAELSDSTMILARLAAAYGIFIKTKMPDEYMNGPDTGADSSSIVPNKRHQYVEPGGIHYLADGEEPACMKPDQPGPIYEAFIRTNLRAVSAGVGQSYSALSGDYSQGSFSSERQAMILERQLFRMECGNNDRKFNNKLFWKWLDWAVLRGKIDLFDYEKNINNYRRVKFSRPRQEYINPVQDVQALSEALNLGIISRTEAIEDRGQDRDDVFNSCADDKKTMKALDIWQDDASVQTFGAAEPRPAAKTEPDQTQEAKPDVSQK